jgi:GNAT superfamily N-acetyltransferase
MNAVCTIRKLDRNDAGAWAELRLEALENHPLAFGASIPDNPRALAELFLERLSSAEESAVFGAFFDSSLVGVVGVRHSAGAKELHKAMILGMYVTARSRRNGAARLLLSAAVEHARTWSGVEQVQLAVSEVAQEAHRLYQSFGFREWGREPRALCWKGRYAGEIHMVLDLR